MPRPLVHIGYHKTASTWFQRAVYPRVRDRAFIDRRTAVHALLEPSALMFEPDAAHRALLAGVPDGDADTIIVCEEELSGYLHNGGLHGCLSREVRRRLQTTLPDADIVIFIRNQIDMIASCYTQYIRGGGTHGITRYLFPKRYLTGALARSHKAPLFSFDHFAYLPLIREYQHHFGPERVHVFPYEAVRDDPTAFLAHFAQRFDLDLDPGEVTASQQNAGYSPFLLQLARVLNLFTRRTVVDKRTLVHLPGWYALRRKLLESLNRSPLRGPAASSRRILGEANARCIEQRYAETNAALAEELGLPLGAYGYPLPPEGSQVTYRLAASAAQRAASASSKLASVERSSSS